MSILAVPDRLYRVKAFRYRGEEMVLQITPLERTVLQWLAEGKDHNEIASRLETIEKGVDADLSALFARLGVRTSADAISAGIKRGLVTAPAQLA